MSIVLNGTTGITAPDIDVTAQTTVADFDAGITLGGSATTLDDYEEGTWTPTGNGITISAGSANYTKVGRLVTASAHLSIPSTANTSTLQVAGLPFTSQTASPPPQGGFVTYTNSGLVMTALVLSASTAFTFYGVDGASVKNNEASGDTIRVTLIYYIA